MCEMKLNEQQKEWLREWGEDEESFPQIEEALDVTTYELDGRKLSRNEVRSYLSERVFLSGILRSAFHWSAVRQASNGAEIYFNSRKLFM